MKKPVGRPSVKYFSIGAPAPIPFSNFKYAPDPMRCNLLEFLMQRILRYLKLIFVNGFATKILNISYLSSASS